MIWNANLYAGVVDVLWHYDTLYLESVPLGEVTEAQRTA
jgi:hypothetical protein